MKNELKAAFLKLSGKAFEKAFPDSSHRQLIEVKKNTFKQHDIYWSTTAHGTYERLFAEFEFSSEKRLLVAIQFVASPEKECWIPSSYHSFASYLFNGELDLGIVEDWTDTYVWVDLGGSISEVEERSEILVEVLRNQVAPLLTLKAEEIVGGVLVDDLTSKLCGMFRRAYEYDSDMTELFEGAQKWVETFRKYSVINPESIDRYEAELHKMRDIYTINVCE